MGLDQYAFMVHPSHVEKLHMRNRYVEVREDNPPTRFAYWRKHNALHGWMERLYREYNHDEQDFNCQPLVLTLEDLDALERDVLENNLPQTQGFFIGKDSRFDPEYKVEDMQFIARAKTAISEGFIVFYDSWW